MTTAQHEYDVAVVGGGSGGYAAARTAAAAGLKTVVVEGGEFVGGLCILRGCMPTKALLQASDVMHQVRRAGVWGIRVGEAGFDFAAVMARKDRLIGEFADFREKQLTDGRFSFIRALARFCDPHRLELSDGRTLTARHFVISTGSRVSLLPVPGLNETGFLTSDGVLQLSAPPRSLIVLGGGAVAVEFAQFFQRFGTAVTLIQRSEHLLRDFDTDGARVVEEVFRREGMTVVTGTQLVAIGRGPAGKWVEYVHGGRTSRAEAQEILLALGRTANTAALGLDLVGVQTENERVLTNSEMRTSAPHIFAAGDCTGPHEIVHIAVQQGEIAAHNIARPRAPRHMDYRLLTSVVFTDPQVATVGLTEKAAAQCQVPFLAATYPFNDHGKSLIMEALDGFVKLLAHPATGEIIGGACVGPMGGELIHEIVAAMQKRMTVHELAAMPHYHPTLAEIWTYPAEALAERIPRRT